MSSPNPNEQYQDIYLGYAGPPYQQPVPVPQSDYRSSQIYTAQDSQAPKKYTLPLGSTPALVAELPGSAPPVASVSSVLPTTTISRQLTEDEQLAHKLQRLEVEEAHVRARSNSNLSQRPSYVETQDSLHNPAMRPHSLSVSSNSPYIMHLSPQPSFSLLPEVVVRSQVVPSSGTFYAQPNPSTLPEVFVGTPQIEPSPQFQQSSFAPALSDPLVLSAHLEQHRKVPYPPQWILAPVTTTLYSSFEYAPKANFLDTLESQIWRSTRMSKTGRSPPPPTFQFKFKSRGGTFLDPKLSWSMSPGKNPSKKTEWNYHVKRNKSTGMRLSEGLTPPQSKLQILTTYVSAVNYDSLRFRANDGRLYQWVTHAPLGSAKGSRFDTLRHALFVADHRSGIQDPLYGHIIADHTYWDGFVDTADVHAGTQCAGCSAKPINGLRWKCKACPDHDVCDPCRVSSASMIPACRLTLVSLPDETLYIRDPNVDVALVVATLQALKDWEMHTLREQKRKDPNGFKERVDEARRGDLGRMRYWTSSDFDGSTDEGEIHGTVLKAVEYMRGINEVGSGSVSVMSGAKDGGRSGVAKERAAIS